MNNTVKEGSKKGERETRVWFSPAGWLVLLHIRSVVYRFGKRGGGIGSSRWRNGVAIKGRHPLGRYTGKEVFCYDSLYEITRFCLFKRDFGKNVNRLSLLSGCQTGVSWSSSIVRLCDTWACDVSSLWTEVLAPLLHSETACPKPTSLNPARLTLFKALFICLFSWALVPVVWIQSVPPGPCAKRGSSLLFPHSGRFPTGSQSPRIDAYLLWSLPICSDSSSKRKNFGIQFTVYPSCTKGGVWLQKQDRCFKVHDLGLLC